MATRHGRTKRSLRAGGEPASRRRGRWHALPLRLVGGCAVGLRPLFCFQGSWVALFSKMMVTASLGATATEARVPLFCFHGPWVALFSKMGVTASLGATATEGHGSARGSLVFECHKGLSDGIGQGAVGGIGSNRRGQLGDQSK